MIYCRTIKWMEIITTFMPPRTLTMSIIWTIPAICIIILIQRTKISIIMMRFNTLCHIISFFIRKIISIKPSRYFPVKLVWFRIRRNPKFVKDSKSFIRVSVDKFNKQATFSDLITIQVKILKTIHSLSFYSYRVHSLMES